MTKKQIKKLIIKKLTKKLIPEDVAEGIAKAISRGLPDSSQYYAQDIRYTGSILAKLGKSLYKSEKL